MSGMLRSSALRASSSSITASSLTSSTSPLFTRSALLATTRRDAPATCLHASQQQHRNVTAHAISNPTLAGIEKRWEQMPPQEQAELWMALRDRMKNSWHELTIQEKKAAYWIAFGPHGPRALDPPGEGWRVFGLTMAGLGVSAVLFFFTRYFAKPPPSTMNREWQEQTNEYLKQEAVADENEQSQKTEPISGISSEGYVGKGQVQSKPKRD
ncbi:MAG: Cytochrome c oxidase subunit 5A [Piccolia ochrophora]|nr:MAG: Cytochrome c oxidase subunit 5A [Piccolia ochrophora]